MVACAGAGCRGLGAGRKGPKKLIILISFMGLIELFGPTELIGLIELIGPIGLIDQIELIDLVDLIEPIALTDLVQQLQGTYERTKRL